MKKKIKGGNCFLELRDVPSNNNWNHRLLKELSDEFEVKIEELHAFYLDSLAGYSVLHERLLGYQEKIRHLISDSEYKNKVSRMALT